MSAHRKWLALFVALALFCALFPFTNQFFYSSKKRKGGKEIIILGHGCHQLVYKEDKKGEMILMSGHDCEDHGEEHHHHHHHHEYSHHHDKYKH